jgi:hypothetical protein
LTRIAGACPEDQTILLLTLAQPTSRDDDGADDDFAFMSRIQQHQWL